MHSVVTAVLRRFCAFALLMFGWCADVTATESSVTPPPTTWLTNLLQLRNNAEQLPSVVRPFRIVADVLGADATNGMLALRDASGVELIRVGFTNRDLEPGTAVCLEGKGCGVKQEKFWLAIVPAMVVDCDGVHPEITESGMTFLNAGTMPITVKWFNWFGPFALNVEYEGPNLPRQRIPSSVLSKGDIDKATGRTNFSAGLDYACYEGVWESLPEFEKYQPAKTGVATNFDLNVRTRDPSVGLVFSGFITIPADGVYKFHLSSDDGSQLFVGDASLDFRVLDKPSVSARDQVLTNVPEIGNRQWVTLEGIATYTSIWNTGGEMQLRVGKNDIRIETFGGGSLAPTIPVHQEVRVSGIYEEVVSEDGSRVPGRLLALNWQAVRPAVARETSVAIATGEEEKTNHPSAGRIQSGLPSQPIATAVEIKSLSSDLAQQELPVSIRGVVTACFSKYLWAVVQDSTKGVFVDLHELKGTESLQRGEACQIEGVTGPGEFAPTVVARRITHLGPGQLPTPEHATREQLVDGSLDTEFVEIEGVVTDIRDRLVALLMQGGKVSLELSEVRPEFLRNCKDAVVRIRGCLFAHFDQETHKVGPGSMVVRSAAIEVLKPAPSDLFDAPRKSMGELLLYDPKAAPFRLLKVSGQIIYGQAGNYFLTDGTNGMHVTLRKPDSFSVGDLVDAVGFLELGGLAAELKEAVLRKTGSAPLRPAIPLLPDKLLQANYPDMLVQVEATLMDRWREGPESVVQLQSGFLAYKARINNRGTHNIDLPPPGSRLELTGAYLPQGNRADDGTVSSFELLVNAPAGLRVLATPPWWNFKRVLVLTGILAVLLLAVLVWNKELQWKVQERGRQLELEIRNRQQAELQRAAEAERSRIARDLHDELGSGLTEVSLLAGAGSAATPETERTHDRFRVIAEKARALVSGLDVIVWAIDPKRNSLQTFTDYLCRYATEVFSASNVGCRFTMPIECDPVTLTETARHSLFLAVKEALNNVIRHSSATEVELQISQSAGRLQIVIADNGCGFNRNGLRRVNGLANLRERLEALNGECHIESQMGRGTIVKFIVPLPGSGS